MNDRNKRISLVTIVFICLIAITFGYAAIITALKINGKVGLGKADFNIHFDNVGTVSHKATVNTEAHISDGEVKKEISFDVYLDKIGDDYKFTADIVNEGSIPGKVDSIELQGISESQARILDYKLYYTGTTREVKPGDYWVPGAVKNTTFVLKYVIKEETLDSDLPTESTSLDLSLVIKFKSGDLDEYRSRAAAIKLSQNTRYMSSSSLDFGVPTSSTEHQGLYVLSGTENDDFPIYFYRGGHETVNNHVKFSGFCWRIMRTTNTGGIKIIYNGVPDENGYCSASGTNQAIIGTTNYTSYGWDFKNSVISRKLEAWYFDNIINNQVYIEDSKYCNSQNTGSLSCDSNREYSVSNGGMNYPIALVTSFELNMSGLSYNSGSTYSWIYIPETYWTMTGFSDYAAYFQQYDGNNSDGLLQQERVNYGHYRGIRPVITLNSEVSLTNGSGTPDDPFTVS